MADGGGKFANYHGESVRVWSEKAITVSSCCLYFTFGFDFAFRVFSVCGVVWVSTCDFIAYATVISGLAL
jgi:hypothetical protein